MPRGGRSLMSRMLWAQAQMIEIVRLLDAARKLEVRATTALGRVSGTLNIVAEEIVDIVQKAEEVRAVNGPTRKKKGRVP